MFHVDKALMIKYIVYPGYVCSVNDGQIKFINGEKLIKLYNVNPDECIIYDVDDKKYHSKQKMKGIDVDILIELRPSHFGDYSIPNKEFL